MAAFCDIILNLLLTCVCVLYGSTVNCVTVYVSHITSALLSVGVIRQGKY